jgi:hypothetical protein
MKKKVNKEKKDRPCDLHMTCIAIGTILVVTS